MHPSIPVSACSTTVAVRFPCGTRETFTSLRRALLATGHGALYPSADGLRVRREGHWSLHGGFLEFRDSHGDLIPAAVILAESSRLAAEHSRWRVLWRSRPFTFREGPVPGTGHRGFSRRLRSLRTTQERRVAAACEADGHGNMVRGARNFHNLPNAWDDIPRSEERSWKRQRRTQWKGKG